MREIKFKAKLSHSKQWVIGNLVIAQNGQPYIIPSEVFEPDGHHLKIDSDEPYWVDKETISQFTGLTDKNGVEVYEHNIIMTEICLMVVVYVATSASFGAVPLKQFNELSDKSNISTDDMYWFDNDIVDFGLYGNIHDK